MSLHCLIEEEPSYKAGRVGDEKEGMNVVERPCNFGTESERRRDGFYNNCLSSSVYIYINL
jgi:hypothetical protein